MLGEVGDFRNTAMRDSEAYKPVVLTYNFQSVVGNAQDKSYMYSKDRRFMRMIRFGDSLELLD